MKRLQLPEFIEVLVPTGDRTGKALSAATLRKWKGRLARYLEAFRKEGERLLVEMGSALDQEAVAYETRDGLTILIL